MKRTLIILILSLVGYLPLYSINLNLPVIYDSVQVQLNGSYIEITWQTISQVNNDYFVVERSTDSVIFIALGFVAGAGTNGSTIGYSYVDSTASLDTNYFYRVKQVDFGGASAYSMVVSYFSTTGIGEENGGQLIHSNLYPNPTSGIVTLSLAETVSTIDFFLYNLSGQFLYIRRDISSNDYKFDFTSLAAGTYLYQVRSNNQLIGRGSLIKE